jgi:hypothetical protein
MFFTGRPKTPLRVLCIAAFEHMARWNGGTLGGGVRNAMAHACDFGALRDDFYDHRALDPAEYRLLRGALRRLAPEAATSHYMQQLRFAERTRPVAAENGFQDTAAVFAYRTRVLEVSLLWLQEISLLGMDPVKFRALVAVACLAQLVDDLLDWREDHVCRRPSYVTAYLDGGIAPRGPVAPTLRAHADRWRRQLAAAAREDVGALPFAVAGTVTWVLVAALLSLRVLR